MIQQRVPYSNSPQGHVWVDPARDISHAFPNYIRRALEVAEYDVNASTLDSVAKQDAIVHLQVDAKMLADFIKSSYGEGRTKTLQDAIRVTSITDAPGVSPIFMRALFKVLLSAYWTGLGFALHGSGEEPVDADLVDKAADTLAAKV